MGPKRIGAPKARPPSRTQAVASARPCSEQRRGGKDDGTSDTTPDEQRKRAIMSVIAAYSTILDGREMACGTMPFIPCDDTSSYALCQANGRTCGVTYDTAVKPHLLFSPDMQLPKGARSSEAWSRFAFDSDEDHLLDINIDFRDGELRYIEVLDCDEDDAEAIEKAIRENIEWITALYPHVLAFVREQLVDGGKRSPKAAF